jgi:hypothetical protein
MVVLVYTKGYARHRSMDVVDLARSASFIDSCEGCSDNEVKIR